MNIYSTFEYKWMRGFQDLKDSLLSPLTRTLAHLHVSAGAVSVASGFVALASLLGAIALQTPLLFIAGIWLHLLLDGLDGAMARSGSAPVTPEGLIADLSADSVGIASMGAYLGSFGYVSLAAAALFVATYLMVNTISFLLAQKDRSYAFVVRPRIFILGALTVDYLSGLHTSSLIVDGADILLTGFVLIGIFTLYKVWSTH